MTPHDEAAFAAELSDTIAASVGILRWVAAAVGLYVIASIGAALWVM
jgi:hypothetical protein